MERLCESCQKVRWRYKCPGCGVVSCSVECVKKHKSELGCQGKRSKAKFISLSNFTTAQLLSDYYFLEEAGRVIDSAHRGSLAISKDASGNRQTLQRVQRTARKKGLSLHLLPQGMARHTINTSRTVWNRDQRRWSIEWRLKLVFPQASQHYCEERVNEDLLLGDVLKRYTHATESDPVLRHRLRCYVDEEYCVFLKLEREPHKCTGYRPLQLSSSLAESLRQCSVVEFPELHVVLSSHVSGYTAGQGGSELAGGDGSKVSSLAWLAESYEKA